MTECAICGDGFEIGDRVTWLRVTTLEQSGFDGKPNVPMRGAQYDRKPVHVAHFSNGEVRRSDGGDSA